MSKKNISRSKNPTAAAALKMHGEIVAEANDLRKRWTALARKCLQFREAKHYKNVKNPETGKPFTSFAEWAQLVFDQSKSTLFAMIRIVRTLDGVVKDEDMEQIGKEKSEILTEAVKAREEITPELTEAAKHGPARELRKRIPKLRLVDEKKKAAASTRNLGPYRVMVQTADQFELALSTAVEKTGDDSGEQTDRAIAFIANTFLSEIKSLEGAHVAEAAA